MIRQPGPSRGCHRAPLIGRRRLVRSAALAAGLAALSGCADLGLLGDIAFAPAVPGLPADGSWVSLPVGAWVIESGVTPLAISACFEATCQPRAAVGLFRAAGPDADALAAGLADPGTVTGLLAGPGRRRGLRPSRRAAGPPSVEGRRVGTMTGYALRIARPDGSREAVEIVLSSRSAAGLTLLIVVSDSLEGADRIARDVAIQLG